MATKKYWFRIKIDTEAVTDTKIRRLIDAIQRFAPSGTQLRIETRERVIVEEDVTMDSPKVRLKATRFGNMWRKD